MEEVAVSPMVAAALVLDNNGADAVSSTAIPSVTISVEEKEEINGDVSTITSAANNDEELFTTPISSRSPSTRKKRGAFGTSASSGRCSCPWAGATA
jgi:hypothetical protein